MSRHGPTQLSEPTRESPGNTGRRRSRGEMEKCQSSTALPLSSVLQRGRSSARTLGAAGAHPALLLAVGQCGHCWGCTASVQGDAGRRSLCFLQCMKQGLIKGGNPFWAVGMWAGRGLWWVPPAVPGSGRLGQRGNSQVFRSSSLPETCLAPCPCGEGTTLEPAAVTPSTAPRSHGAAPLNSW